MHLSTKVLVRHGSRYEKGCEEIVDRQPFRKGVDRSGALGYLEVSLAARRPGPSPELATEDHCNQSLLLWAFGVPRKCGTLTLKRLDLEHTTRIDF